MSDHSLSNGTGEREGEREEDGGVVGIDRDVIEYSDDFRSLSNESDATPPHDDEQISPDPNVTFFVFLSNLDTASAG